MDANSLLRAVHDYQARLGDAPLRPSDLETIIVNATVLERQAELANASEASLLKAQAREFVSSGIAAAIKKGLL